MTLKYLEDGESQQLFALWFVETGSLKVFKKDVEKYFKDRKLRGSRERGQKV